jgi:hypothetical protein
VDINDLDIDHGYQRDEVSKANTLAIARNFSWNAFGVLVVMRRANGRLYIVDGQQRWLAAKHRGDIHSVPCLIFESQGPQHEAKAFYYLNINRRNVRPFRRFMAAVQSQMEPEYSIAQWMEQNDLSPSDSSNHPRSVAFLAILVNSWKWDKEAAQRALLVQAEVVGQEYLSSDIHRGMVYLINKGVHLEEFIEKMQTSGGRTVLLRDIKAVQIAINQMGNYAICAQGILRTINKGRTRKITLEGVEI